jgi:hypothetical protein
VILIIPVPLFSTFRQKLGKRAILFSLLTLSIVLVSCQLPASRGAQMDVRIEADGGVTTVQVPIGSTVNEALQVARITAGSLDRTEPPSYVVVEAGATIRIVRVEEKFRTEVRTVPFNRQILRNESLPEGVERLVQPGVNGQEELTYRSILEDGMQTSETVMKSVLLSEPVAEIVMIGSRSGASPINIPGTLAYLSAGNAWTMEVSTASRRLLVNTGDLDGRVFALSPDASYLLFTRRSEKAANVEINTLWAAPIDPESSRLVSLKAANVVHFAAWYPGQSSAVAYSTVEPRANAPGWQANNDLLRTNLSGSAARILDAQSGGVYGWWGTSFAFSQNGRLAYSRPDGIGLVSQDGGYLAPIVTINPLQTHGDWAWAPGIAWGGDSETLFYVDHSAPSDSGSAEGPSRFDLRAVSLSSNTTLTLATDVGMFALPTTSPRIPGGGSGAYEIAYLQAIFPEQSDVSRYRLVVMDRDGSNRRELFPQADLPGLDPQRPAWAPEPVADQDGLWLSVVYRGNLWLVDSGNGRALQVTTDGLVSAVDWK